LAWDSKALNDSFLAKAESCERRLEEARWKAKTTPAYEREHDMALAQFFVYNSMHGKMFLETREKFLCELQRLSKTSAPFSGQAFDEARFAKFYADVIRQLIESHRHDERGR